MNFIDAVHSHLCHRVTYLSALLWKVEAGGAGGGRSDIASASPPRTSSHLEQTMRINMKRASSLRVRNDFALMSDPHFALVRV